VARSAAISGPAPGVGKTYAALEEAHHRATRGTNVIIGYVDNRGSSFGEFDVDTVTRSQRSR
jgi:Mrp family chromosome partitioning ATPase